MAQKTIHAFLCFLLFKKLIIVKNNLTALKVNLSKQKTTTKACINKHSEQDTSNKH